MPDASPVCAALDALRAAERRVAWWQAGAAAAALVLFFPLLYAEAGRVPLAGALLIWTAYLGRKTYGALRAGRAARQTRLERRFVQHPFSPEALQRCLRRADHLWAGSLVLCGLRLLSAHPLGAALPPEARLARARQRFRQALRPLWPPRWYVDVGLTLALAATAVGLGAARSAAGAGALGTLLVAEGMAGALRGPLRRRGRRLVRALGAWALAAAEEAGASPGRAYEHTLLYYAPPWFGPPGGAAREVPAAPSSASPPGQEAAA